MFGFRFVPVSSEHDSAGEPGTIAGMEERYPVEEGSAGAQCFFVWLGEA